MEHLLLALLQYCLSLAAVVYPVVIVWHMWTQREEVLEMRFQGFVS